MSRRSRRCYGAHYLVEVLGKAPAQAIGLADVDQRTFVIELVHTLPRRKGSKFLVGQWSCVKIVKSPDQLT